MKTTAIALKAYWILDGSGDYARVEVVNSRRVRVTFKDGSTREATVRRVRSYDHLMDLRDAMTEAQMLTPTVYVKPDNVTLFRFGI